MSDSTKPKKTISKKKRDSQKKQTANENVPVSQQEDTVNSNQDSKEATSIPAPASTIQLSNVNVSNDNNIVQNENQNTTDNQDAEQKEKIQDEAITQEKRKLFDQSYKQPPTIHKPSDIFEKLINIKTEPKTFDFKAIVHNLKTPEGKLSFIEDVVCLYNALGEAEASGTHGGPAAYLVYGVSNQQEKGENRLIGLACHLDNAKFQLALQPSVTPFIEIIYHQIERKGLKFGLLEIRRLFRDIAFLNASPRKFYTRVDGTNIPPQHIQPSHIQELQKLFRNFKNYSHNLGMVTLPRSFLTLSEYAGQEIISKISEPSECYKILIVNQPHVSLQDDMHFLRHIGHLKWNLIIDLDRSSRKCGLYTQAEPVLKNNVAVSPISILSQQLLKKGTSIHDGAWWILLNGCAYANSKAPSNFSSLMSDTQALLKKFFDDIREPLPVLCFTLFLGNAQIKEVTSIQDSLRQAYEAAEDKFSSGGLHHVSVAVDPYLRTVLSRDTIFIPLSQLASCLNDAFGTQDASRISFPGRSADGSIDGSVYQVMKRALTIFHNNCAAKIQAEVEKSDNPEAVIFEKKLKYAQGQKVSIDHLHLNIPIERVEYNALHERVSTCLYHQRQKNMEQLNNFFKIFHTPNAGGTNCLYWTLWKLRSAFPAILIDQVTQDTPRHLELIASESKLPLLLGFDCSVTPSVVFELVDGLSSKKIKCTILHCQRVNTAAPRPKTDWNKNILVLTQKLDQTDLGNFRLFYKSMKADNKKLVKSQHRLILMPLCAFLDKHQKIKAHIEDCLRNATPEEKTIISLALFAYKFASHPLYFTIICKILHRPLHMGVKVLDHLSHNVIDLLVETGHGLHPPLEYVVDVVMNQDPRFAVDTVQTLLQLCEQPLSAFPTLENIVTSTFILRKDLTKKTSIFVSYLQDHIGLEATLKIFTHAADVTGLPHIRAHLARFLSRCFQDRFAEAIQHVENALESESNDCIIWTVCGDVYRLALGSQYRDITLDKALEYFNKGIQAYEKGRVQERNWHAYTGEASIREVFLENFKQFTCDNEPIRFLKAVKEAQYSPVSVDSYEQALQMLDKMDSLCTKFSTEPEASEISRMKGFRLRIRLAKLLDVANLDAMFAEISSCAGYIALAKSSPDYRSASWEAVSARDHANIYAKLSQKIQYAHKPLRSDFEHLIQSMIWCHYHDYPTAKGGLQEALTISKRWCECYKNDPRGFFFTHVFYFIQALSEKKEDKKQKLLEESHNYRQMCINICEREEIKESQVDRFYLAVGNGLKAIIPAAIKKKFVKKYFWEHEAPKLLKTIEGKLSSDGHWVFNPEIRNCRASNVSDSSSLFADRRSEPDVIFHLSFRFSGIVARIIYDKAQNEIK